MYFIVTVVSEEKEYSEYVVEANSAIDALTLAQQVLNEKALAVVPTSFKGAIVAGASNQGSVPLMSEEQGVSDSSPASL